MTKRVKTDRIFFNNFCRDGKTDKYDRVVGLTKHCIDLDEIEQALVENGFELIDVERHVRSDTFKYADNNRTIVKTHCDNRLLVPITVNVSDHSFDTVQKLQGFHSSFKRICNMSPMEMQE